MLSLCPYSNTVRSFPYKCFFENKCAVIKLVTRDILIKNDLNID